MMRERPDTCQRVSLRNFDMGDANDKLIVM
jgi:hypothetical protein